MLKNVAICIPTRGRPDRQSTIDNLPDELKKITYLIVDQNEYRVYKKYSNKVKAILKFPSHWGNFIFDKFGSASDKKQWIIQNIKERYFFLFDDDLSFNIREGSKLVKARKRDIYKSFKIMYLWMKKEGIAHVGLSGRNGNNRVEEDYAETTRCIMACGFDLKVIRKEKIKVNRLALMADFDTTLQLLERGYKNRVLYTCAIGHRKSNDDGGCSIYRTPDRLKENAVKLHALHPKSVRVEQKKTKTPWPGFDNKTRTDVTIGWKKSYKIGLSQRTRKNALSFL